MTNRNKAIIAIILSAVLGGGNAVFNKIGLKEFPPFIFIVLRFILCVLVLLPFITKKQFKFDKDLLKLIVISVFPVMNILLFTFSVRNTSANIATMIYTCTPIIVAILSYLKFKEKYSLKKISGILLGFIGTALIVLLPVIEKKANLNISLTSNLMMFAGMVFFGIYTTLSKDLQKNHSPVFITLIFSLVMIFISSIFAFFEVKNNPGLFMHISVQAWVALFYVGVFGSIALYVLLQFAIKYATSLIASTNSYLQPVSGVVWAALMLGESVSFEFILGALITLFGVYLVTRTNDRI